MSLTLLDGGAAEKTPREKILLKSLVKWESANTPGRWFYGTLQRRYGDKGVIDGKVIALARLIAVTPLRSRFTGGAA